MKGNLRTYINAFKQEGTTRDQRYPAALNPRNIAVDDRTLEDLIVFARRYYKNILFIPAKGEIDVNQSWEILFNNNTVLLMANIASRIPGDIKLQYDVLRKGFKDEPTLKNFTTIAEFVFSRFKKIDEWHVVASAHVALNNDLLVYIKSYLTTELWKLNDILNYLRHLGKHAVQPVYIESLVNRDNVWEVPEAIEVPVNANLFNGKTDEEKFNDGLLSLDKIFDSVFHVMSNMIRIGKGYFTSTIYSQQSHPPHIALLITFLDLFGVVQAEMNKLPGKVLGYYYKDVLGLKPKGAIADKTFVTFELAKGFDSFRIKTATALNAGKDKGNVPISYLTDKEIVINKSQVEAIKTLFIQKNKAGINNYYADTIKSNGFYKVPAGVAWSIFGTIDQANLAGVGFGISSAQFYLAKGQRNISLMFKLTDDVLPVDIDTTLLSLRLTGEIGWISSLNTDDKITINHFKPASNVLELSFSISIAQRSAVVAYDANLHKGNYSTDKPVLELLLQYPSAPIIPDKEHYENYIAKIKQLDYLQKLVITGIEVLVMVGSSIDDICFDGVRDLVLQNHDAVLDPKKPFQPFTALPQVGSSFYVGCNDLFYKSIQALSLNIDWMLPDNFRTHYDKYFPPYDSNKFNASVSLLENQQWKPLVEAAIIDAYAPEPQFMRLAFYPGTDKVNSVEDSGKQISKFDITKHDGTLRIKLGYPDFGHGIYSQLITASVMEKASSKLAVPDFYKIIKGQLHDSVISIKYPADIKSSPLKGSIYSVFNSWSKIEDKESAKESMIGVLTENLQKLNGSQIQFSDVKKFSETMNAAETNKTAINDDNFVERVVRFLKKINLINKSVHFDRNKQDVDDVVNKIIAEKHIEPDIEFVLPAEQEIAALIIAEVNLSIAKVVIIVVNQLFKLRETSVLEDHVVNGIFKHEIDMANEVINDLIAHKIAAYLSANDVPPKPYTPVINTFSISYKSQRELSTDKDSFFQIQPFGVKKIYPFSGVERVDQQQDSVFPGYLLNQAEDLAKPSGMLILGIKEILPDQNLSLLFQLAEGTGACENASPQLNWWYLKGNEWLRLPNKYLILDTTYGLQTTGIVEISVPRNAGNYNTLFEEGELFWLAVSVPRDVDSFPLIVDIVAQAVSVTFADDGNDADYLASPLPAGKITQLYDKIPSVRAVTQPTVSSGGKVPEDDREFYTRVSERLRHKERAICNWDYERLMLQRFPFIYKIKCLSNYKAGKFAIGHVTLVPIINLINRGDEKDRISMPLSSYVQLQDMKDFIHAKSSPFAKMHVINPQLDYIKISCSVRFDADVDKGYYLEKLNEDIIRFLTPWADGSTHDISFSAKIHVSNIVNFINRLPYVNYLDDLHMNQYTLHKGTEFYCTNANNDRSLTETQFITEHSILVSAPVHDIQYV